MHIFKRGNRWWVSEHIRGKQVRRSLGPHVKSKTQALATVGLGPSPLDEPDLTLKDFFNDFLMEARIRISRATEARYWYAFKVIMDELGESFLVAHLTTRHLSLWASKQLRRGRKPDGINVDLRHIRAALRRGEELGLLAAAPMVDMVKTSKRLPRHLTPEQFDKILAAETHDEYRRLWTFFVWTGLRRAEALNLDWSHVDLGDKPTMQVIGKGDRERVVPILPPALAAMGEIKPSGPVFSMPCGSHVSSRFKKAARAAGVPDFHLHDLRHTCLTWLVGQKVPLKLVQDIAGHSTITTTMRYAKIFTGDAHDILNAAFGF